ncbi:MAG: hypothetical protein U0414_11405 [Polyangiaceae bacterium]
MPSFRAALSSSIFSLLALSAGACDPFTGPPGHGGGGGASSSADSTASSTVTTDAASSSSSSTGCPSPCDGGVNATGECVGGTCKYTCAPDFGDCDDDPSTCEVDLTADDHCGSCDTVCGTHCAVIDAKHQCNDPVQAAAGASHTCAVRRDGSVWCWGFNNWGQVGIGSMVQTQFVPALITLPFKAKAVRARFNSTCAIGVGGEVACWGQDGNDFYTPLLYTQFTNVTQLEVGGLNPANNGDGLSLFIGDAAGSARSFIVSNVTEPGSALIQAAQVEVAAGGGHYCVRNLAGEVRCAGANSKNQLGMGFPTTTEAMLHKIDSFTAKAIALGGRHSCGITPTDTLECWGDNNQSQVGIPGVTHNVPKDIPIPGGAPVEQIVLGDEHSAALAGGALYLWGSNVSHQSSQAADMPVLSPTAYPLANVTTMALGTSHTCAITSAGKMLCWGANGGYQLGTGTTAPSSTPVEPLWP